MDGHDWNFWGLVHACEAGDLQAVKKFIAAGANPAQYLSLPMWCAAEAGQFEIVKYLSTFDNVDINSGLIFAASAGQAKIVRYLASLPNIDLGAGDSCIVLDESYNKNAAIKAAINNGYSEVAEYLAQEMHKRQIISNDTVTKINDGLKSIAKINSNLISILEK